MIDEIQFSGRGRKPTSFEVRLLHQTAPDSAWGPLVHRLIADYGPQMAAELLCKVMEELGAGKISVPQRESFFRSLWGRERDALICQLAGRPDWSTTEIASSLGVSEVWVRRVVRTSRDDSSAAPVVDTDR